MENIKNYDYSAFLSEMYDDILSWGVKLIITILILIIGFWIIKYINRGVAKIFEKKDLESTLKIFFQNLISYSLKIILVISVASIIGIKMTSFIAILAAVTFAIGMGFQGTLGNLASGVLLLVFRPFKVGDYIEGAGKSGTVHDVQLFFTTLKTADKKTITIPNGQLASHTIINYSIEPVRRLDITVGIGYNDDIDKARKVLQSLIDADVRALKEPASEIHVTNLGDSSVDVQMRIFVNSADYWSLKFYLTELVKKTFDSEGISIPFPQQDVHIIHENNINQ